MKRYIVTSAALLLGILTIYAQDSTQTRKPKKSLSEKIEALPDMLIYSPTNPSDSVLSLLKNDNLVLTINPQWTEKGTQTNNDIKIPKINEEPLKETFPLPDKDIANGLTITLATYKKPVDDRKNAVLNMAKAHLAAYYKEAGKAISADELAANAQSFVTGPEPFTTKDGKQGELYFINDIAPQQTSFLAVLLMPGVKPNTTSLVQFNYFKYTYESVVPDDYTELRFFVYPDDQKTYENFTKGYLKSLKIE